MTPDRIAALAARYNDLVAQAGGWLTVLELAAACLVLLLAVMMAAGFSRRAVPLYAACFALLVAVGWLRGGSEEVARVHAFRRDHCPEITRGIDVDTPPRDRQRRLARHVGCAVPGEQERMMHNYMLLGVVASM